MADTPKVTRLEIARLTKGDERMTRFLEALFRAVNDQTPKDIEAIRSDLSDVTAESAIAIAQAINCKAELGRIADALELIASKPEVAKNLPITTDYVDFDPYGPHESRQYRVQWNEGDGTLDVGLTGDVVLQVGQETMYFAKNGTASTIPNGTPVMITGAVGASGKLEFGLAVANGSVNRDLMMGVTTQDIGAGEFGYVTHFGMVRHVDTTGAPYSETWAEGDLLYFSDVTPGEWTNIKPPSTAITSPFGLVVRRNASSGIIFVRMSPNAGECCFNESSSALTYTSGVLTRIDYVSGNYKLFTYTAGVLTQLDYVRPGQTTIRKVFTYTDGVLSSITQTEV